MHWHNNQSYQNNQWHSCWRSGPVCRSCRTGHCIINTWLVLPWQSCHGWNCCQSVKTDWRAEVQVELELSNWTRIFNWRLKLVHITTYQISGLWHSPPRMKHQGNSLQVKNSFLWGKKWNLLEKIWDEIMSCVHSVMWWSQMFM